MDMKKSSSGRTDQKNVKGFTLVELVVVIAIIAILAGIANLAVQGFIRNARLETANDNARILFTGFQNIVTQCEIKQDNTVISPSFANDPDLEAVVVEFKVYNGDVQVYSFDGGSEVKKGTDYTGGMIKGYSDVTANSNKGKLPSEIANIIDNTFDGEAKVYIDYINYEVKSVVFKPMSESNQNTTLTNFFSGSEDGDLSAYATSEGVDYYTYYDGNAQDTAYKNHPLYGVYPYQKDIA